MVQCKSGGANGAAASYSWAIAVVICMVACTVSNLGLNFQKKALSMRQSKDTSKRMHYKALWIIGFFGIVVGAIGDFAALAFGAQSIVAPLGSLTLVANVFIAPVMHGEKLTRNEILGTISIIVGCAVAVAFASHKDCLYSIDALFALYRTTRFAVYGSIVVAVVIVMLIWIHRMERIQAHYGDNHIKYQKVLVYHRFSYATISGIAGAQSVLFAKTTVELITDSVSGGAIFLAKPATYAILVAMGSTVTLQIYWLNKGLARWDALYNVPVFQSFWILVSVIGGGVFYEEFDSFSGIQFAMFPLGIMLTMAGVAYLSMRRASKEGDDVSASGDLESTRGLLRRDSDASVSSVIATMHESSALEVTAYRLQLKLELTSVLLTAPSSKRSRKKTVWCLKEVPDWYTPPATGRVLHVGDVLVEVNRERVISKWVSHTDAIRRLLNATTRPLWLRFQGSVPAHYEPAIETSTPSLLGSSIDSRPDVPTPVRRAAMGTPFVVFDASSSRDASDSSDRMVELGLEISLARGFDPDAFPSVSLRVTDPSTVRDALTSAHRGLRGHSMNPLTDLIHFGDLIYPNTIDKDDDDVLPHPVAAFMERFLPSGGSHWKILDSLVDHVEREKVRPRTHSLGREPRRGPRKAADVPIVGKLLSRIIPGRLQRELSAKELDELEPRSRSRSHPRVELSASLNSSPVMPDRKYGRGDPMAIPPPMARQRSKSDIVGGYDSVAGTRAGVDGTPLPASYRDLSTVLTPPILPRSVDETSPLSPRPDLDV